MIILFYQIFMRASLLVSFYLEKKKEKLCEWLQFTPTINIIIVNTAYPRHSLSVEIFCMSESNLNRYGNLISCVGGLDQPTCAVLI